MNRLFYPKKGIEKSGIEKSGIEKSGIHLFILYNTTVILLLFDLHDQMINQKLTVSS